LGIIVITIHVLIAGVAFVQRPPIEAGTDVVATADVILMAITILHILTLIGTSTAELSLSIACEFGG
jgi:hypothetical protein